jgi:hypothetical protein
LICAAPLRSTNRIEDHFPCLLEHKNTVRDDFMREYYIDDDLMDWTKDPEDNEQSTNPLIDANTQLYDNQI